MFYLFFLQTWLQAVYIYTLGRACYKLIPEKSGKIKLVPPTGELLSWPLQEK